jgi:hypothetical protein
MLSEDFIHRDYAISRDSILIRRWTGASLNGDITVQAMFFDVIHFSSFPIVGSTNASERDSAR